MTCKAKIVATIGPSSCTAEMIEKLAMAGMNVARLNFSHGKQSEHAEWIHLIREVSERVKKPIAILQDLQGPKLRVGEIPEGGIELLDGDLICLTSSSLSGFNRQNGKVVIPLNIPDLERAVIPGNRILLDDGKLELTVVEILGNLVVARVVVGGLLTSHKGVNLPGANLEIPCITTKDESDLFFGLTQGVDAIALSFVKSAKDILALREMITNHSPEHSQTSIIAKIERPEAMVNLDEILKVVDGVMVARGDLAVETSPSAVPIMQKTIIQAANQHSKFVITATQMLESMVNNPRPTRAEASDVANAIFDNTDAVMLSAETASGKFPVESVAMMVSILEEAEKHYSEWGECLQNGYEPSWDDAVSITRAAGELARDRNVAGIAIFTLSGKTALLMSKARPKVPIFAFTPFIHTYQKMALYWNVTPRLVPLANSVEEMLKIVDNALLEVTHLIDGQQVVVVSGLPINAMRKPNLALLHTIGEKY